MSGDPIYVTKPYLPPLEEYLPYLQTIWANQTLTNNGPLHQQFEDALCQHLGVEHLSLFTNGTLALLTALKSLGIRGEVITTPYTFVATANALEWAGLTPVFVDIEPGSFNIDPDRIEEAITDKTSAIMPVHTYGYPCQVERIQKIGEAYKLPVIYDAAHAFGVNYKGSSLLSHGSLSAVSFHATKIFNTFEGGALICPDQKTKQDIDRLKNFGFVSETEVVSKGINGKMCEMQAAMGLLQLKHCDTLIGQREQVDRNYRRLLRGIPGINVPALPETTRHNFSYFPIIVEEEYSLSRDELYTRMKEKNIFCRRYFFPLVTELQAYRKHTHNSHSLPVATELTEKVLCLPFYPSLSAAEQQRIVNIIRGER